MFSPKMRNRTNVVYQRIEGEFSPSEILVEENEEEQTGRISIVIDEAKSVGAPSSGTSAAGDKGRNKRRKPDSLMIERLSRRYEQL